MPRSVKERKPQKVGTDCSNHRSDLQQRWGGVTWADLKFAVQY